MKPKYKTFRRVSNNWRIIESQEEFDDRIRAFVMDIGRENLINIESLAPLVDEPRIVRVWYWR